MESKSETEGIVMNRERRVQVSARTDIAAPPEVVYRWVTEPGRVISWVKDLVESRPVEDGAPLQVGARAIEVLKAGGKMVEVPSQVTALEPGRLIENRLDMKDGFATSRVVVTATSTGCSVTQSMDYAFTDMRLLPSSVVAKMLGQRLDGDLRRLKTLVESD